MYLSMRACLSVSPLFLLFWSPDCFWSCWSWFCCCSFELSELVLTLISANLYFLKSNRCWSHSFPSGACLLRLFGPLAEEEVNFLDEPLLVKLSFCGFSFVTSISSP